MPNAINWFEIPAHDLDRATRFYETLLGRKLKRENFFGQDLAIFARDKDDDGSVAGALVRNERRTPASVGTVVYLDARGDLDGVLARAAAAGGRVILPKQAIGDAGYLALIADTEGNTVGLHSPPG